MKFHRIDEIVVESGEQVFRARFETRLFFLILVWGSAVLLPILVRDSGWIWYFSGVLGFFGLFIFGEVRAALKPGNFLLRCQSERILINPRSFLNWRICNDEPHIIGLEYSEIACAKKVELVQDFPGIGGEGQRENLTYLDIKPANVDLITIEGQLKAEQARRGPDRKFKFVTIGATYAHDHPVQMLENGVLRLCWKRISPDAAKALHHLSKRIKIAPQETKNEVLTADVISRIENPQAKIRELVKSGDRMSAIRLTREIYGCSLTEAVKCVEKLEK